MRRGLHAAQKLGPDQEPGMCRDMRYDNRWKAADSPCMHHLGTPRQLPSTIVRRDRINDGGPARINP